MFRQLLFLALPDVVLMLATPVDEDDALPEQGIVTAEVGHCHELPAGKDLEETGLDAYQGKDSGI